MSDVLSNGHAKPLDGDEFLLWATRAGLSEEARALVQRVRTNPPARRVRSSVKNVSGTYPSAKMGCAIQYESRHVEFAGIVLMERDPHVIEFYDQPAEPVFFDYKNADGKRRVFQSTPDFFVIDDTGAGWDEWKREEELLELAASDPVRWVRDENGWRCPPAESYAAKFGLRYRLRSSSEIKPIFVANFRFLERYFRRSREVAPSTAQSLRQWVGTRTALTATELLAAVPTASADDLHQLICEQRLHVDLETENLADPGHVHVFLDAAHFAKHQCLLDTLARESLLPPAGVVRFEPGAFVSWDGEGYEVLNAGSTSVTLKNPSNAVVVLTNAEVEDLARRGQLKPIEGEPELRSRLMASIRPYDPARLQRAVSKAEAVRAYQSDGTVIAPLRTVQRWVAERRDGGFEGLLDKKRPGNQKPRLEQRTYGIMEEALREAFATTTAPNAQFAYGTVLNRCRDEGLQPPSLVTFRDFIGKHDDYQLARSRLGRRGAYSREPWSEHVPATPTNGSRPWELAHLDHTELDIQLVDSRDPSIRLGRPWASFLIDAYSRRILALWLSFDPPSYRAAMMSFRLCGQRWLRLFERLGVDGGKEFASVYFETLLARWEVGKETRPAAKPRFGSVLERLIGSANLELIHNLPGNTKLSRNVRQLSKETNPARLATWTLGRLYDVMNEWAFEIYDTSPHAGLAGSSPRHMYELGMKNSGSHGLKLIADVPGFVFDTMPSTQKGVAMVDESRGVKINGVLYWHPLMGTATVAGQEVPVRYDPSDIRRGWAYLVGEWRECQARQMSHLPAISEREFAILSAEIDRRLTVTSDAGPERAASIARKIEESNEKAELQRRRDGESQAISGEPEESPPQAADDEVPPAAQPDSRPRRALEPFL